MSLHTAIVLLMAGRAILFGVTAMVRDLGIEPVVQRRDQGGVDGVW